MTVHLKVIPIMKQDQSYKIYLLATAMHLTKNSIIISSSFNILRNDTIDPGETGDDIDDELFFSQLHHEYERSRKDEMEKQLMEVRAQKHKLFLGVNGNVNLKDTVNPVITNKMFHTN